MYHSTKNKGGGMKGGGPPAMERVLAPIAAAVNAFIRNAKGAAHAATLLGHIRG